MSETRNSKVLDDFVAYCAEHTEERFWQALANWSGYPVIYACTDPSGEGESLDTFHWEGKDE